MSIINRRYRMLDDFMKASDFLCENYNLADCNGYLLKPFFEYAHTHPLFSHNLTHRFGVWEDQDRIVALTCYEMVPGEAFLCAARGYEKLLCEMLEQAENNLYQEKEGVKTLYIWVTDKQHHHIDLISKNGYSKIHKEAVTIYKYENGFRDTDLPNGFRAFSLTEDNDIEKIHRCLHKGFDHPGEPDDDFDCRLLMQSGPGFRPDLATVIKAPNGYYVCYAGMWIDKANRFAYLEPLATVPEYRGMGLASYALTRSMKKTVGEGAQYCFGGVGGFYKEMGFEVIMHRELWKKTFL